VSSQAGLSALTARAKLFRRRKARAGEFGEVAVWVLYQIGFELLASMAVLDGLPERKIERMSSGLRGRRHIGFYR
jgi:hypothetical protein